MSFFSKIADFFRKGFGRKKRDDAWGERFEIASNDRPNNNLPLEPEKDPWRR